MLLPRWPSFWPYAAKRCLLVIQKVNCSQSNVLPGKALPVLQQHSDNNKGVQTQQGQVLVAECSWESSNKKQQLLHGRLNSGSFRQAWERTCTQTPP